MNGKNRSEKPKKLGMSGEELYTEWRPYKDRKDIVQMHPSSHKYLYKNLKTGKVIKSVYHHGWSGGWFREELVKEDLRLIKKADKKLQEAEQ